MTDLDVSARCATKRWVDRRLAALVAIVASSGAFAACTVLNDLDGYAGGTADTGTAAPIDTGTIDSSVRDTGTKEEDTFVDPDTGVPAMETAVDTMVVVDSAMDSVVVVDSSLMDTADGSTCGATYVGFGLSEFQVRGTFGMGDKREWIELTNYRDTPLDVSSVTVKIFSSGAEKASHTFAGGTTVATGGAVVLVGEKATFTADVMTTYMLGIVFDFVRADYLLNSGTSEVRLFGPGCTTPFETAVVPSKVYSIGQPWAYPPPSVACPASARLLAGGALGPAWKEVPTSTPTYGSYAIDGGMQNLYGTPTKANNVACP